MADDTFVATSSGTSGTTTSGRTLVTAVALGVVVGAGIVLGGIIGGLIFAGDEAPIRVKNGSIDLELVHNSTTWKENGNRKKWKMSSGAKASDAYEVYITPSNASSCAKLQYSAKQIAFKYSDGTLIGIVSSGHKTQLTSDKDLTKSSNGQHVTYNPNTGYMSAIQIDGTDVCTFSAADAGLVIVMLDK